MHRAEELLHKFWTKDVGKEGYNKKEWRELASFIEKWVAKEKKEQAAWPLSRGG